MSKPLERVQDDLKTTLKAGEKEKLQTLRMLLADVKNEGIRLGREVEDGEFLSLVQKAIKRRHDAAEQYRKGNRPELADKEEREISCLEEYLPQQASEDEIRGAIQEWIRSEGISGPAAMGSVMKAMRAKFQGTADGGTLSRIAREVLASS